MRSIQHPGASSKISHEGGSQFAQVDAELARNLGCALITHAIIQAAGMSFESYDRFFPTQSTIPEGGFGNLIALPFQGRPQSKRGLSNKAQNRIRRLAAFGNPEFYKKQAMHRSVHNIPRIVWCGEEDERSIMLSRGCEQKLIDLAREQGFACIFDDKRNNGAPIKAEFSGTLRDRQQRAADSLLRHTPTQVSWNRCCSISRVLSPGESRSR